MERGRLNLFKAAVEAQLEEISEIFERIEERRKQRGIIATESLAYQLHNLYCAFEDLFKIVADLFENTVEDSGKYHLELLYRMKLSVDGIRPALLSEQSFQLLNRLRAFRHFFRHACSYELDPRKVELVLEDALELKALYRRDVERFLREVESALGQPEERAD